jgi:hypothetical protein
MDISKTQVTAWATNAVMAQKQNIGSEVIQKTLDTLATQPVKPSADADYDFQTKVLGAAYGSRGTVIDSMA